MYIYYFKFAKYDTYYLCNIYTPGFSSGPTRRAACWDARLSNLSSSIAMKSNGWIIENLGKIRETRVLNPEQNCGRNTFYGWKTPGSTGPGSVKAVFLHKGFATLDYGNCHPAGAVDVLLQDKSNMTARKISTAKGFEKSVKVRFEVYPGTALIITTTLAILKLNSLDVACSGKLNFVNGMYCLIMFFLFSLFFLIWFKNRHIALLLSPFTSLYHRYLLYPHYSWPWWSFGYQTSSFKGNLRDGKLHCKRRQTHLEEWTW